MHNILELLHGKKAIIFGLVHLTNAFLALKGVYDADVSAYIAGVLTLLAGGVDYKTTKLLGTTRK